MRRIRTADVTTVLDLALKLEKAYSKLVARLEDYGMEAQLIIYSADRSERAVDCSKGIDIIADISEFLVKEAKETELIEAREAEERVETSSYPRQQQLPSSENFPAEVTPEEASPPDEDFYSPATLQTLQTLQEIAEDEGIPF